jgi:hypothetical protein
VPVLPYKADADFQGALRSGALTLTMLASITLALALSSTASAGLVQKPYLRVPLEYRDQAYVVRQMFSTSYKTYTKYAYGHDDLDPVNKTFNDPRNGIHNMKKGLVQ